MDTNKIFEEAKRDGFVQIYTDTPEEVVSKIKRYNEEMGECRVNRKRARSYEVIFQLINPVYAAVLGLITLIGGENIVLSLVTTLVFLAVYVVFTFMKKNMIVVTIASATLLLVGMGALVLLLSNLALLVFYMNIDSELKTHDGYSAFNDIRLIYCDKATPVKEEEEGE